MAKCRCGAKCFVAPCEECYRKRIAERYEREKHLYERRTEVNGTSPGS